MKTTFRHHDGRLLVSETAGGTGGGATSATHRPATPEEEAAFHAGQVYAAEAEMRVAYDKFEAAKAERDAHAARFAPPPEPEPEVAPVA